MSQRVRTRAGPAEALAEAETPDIYLSREPGPATAIVRAFSVPEEHHVAFYVYVRICVRRSPRQGRRLHLRLRRRRLFRAGSEEPRRVRDLGQERHGGPRW